MIITKIPQAFPGALGEEVWVENREADTYLITHPIYPQIQIQQNYYTTNISNEDNSGTMLIGEEFVTPLQIDGDYIYIEDPPIIPHKEWLSTFSNKKIH